MGKRLRLDEVRCEVQDSRVLAKVQLSNGGLSHIGLATGFLPEANLERVAAQATINAVRMFAAFTGADRPALTLQDVDVITSPSTRTVLVLLRLGHGDEARFLSGSAAVREDATTAAARAVLDGLNRQIEALLLH